MQLHDSWRFPNCKLITRDGIETFTHKIVLAARSEVMKEILMDIPEGSEVVMIFPDFVIEDVNLLLENMMDEKCELWSTIWEVLDNEEKLKDDDIMELEAGEIPTNKLDPADILQDKSLLENDAENILINKTSKKDFYCFDELVRTGTAGNIEHHPAEILQDIVKESPQDKSLIENDAENILIDKTSKNEFYCFDELERSDTVERTEHDTTFDRKYSVQIKQKLFEEATEDFLSGKSSSLKKAARKFGIPQTTLYRVFVSRKEYVGSGSRSKVFTAEEEEDIATKALQKINEGKDITWQILKDMLMVEMEMLKTKEPNRDMTRVSSTQGSLLNVSFVRRFAERNGLSKYVLKKFTVLNRQFQCEECNKTFSFKNALVKHSKTQHK